MEITYYNFFMKQNETFSKFGQNLREIRRRKGYTQTKLAELSGISQRAIVHCEKHVKSPSIEKVKKLADALDVTIEELLGISGTKKTKRKSEDVSYKIMKKVRVIEKLPTRDQNAIFHYINSLAEKNKLKGKIKEG